MECVGNESVVHVTTKMAIIIDHIWSNSMSLFTSNIINIYCLQKITWNCPQVAELSLLLKNFGKIKCDDDKIMMYDFCYCYPDVRWRCIICTNVGTGNQNRLNQVTLPILNDHRCASVDKLCAGPLVAFKSICQGDSGGPLVCKRGNTWYQYGVNSFVFSCTDAGVPSGFADVAHFSDWIQQKTSGMCLLVYGLLLIAPQ